MKMNLAVQIVRYVDNHQPGWVECQFVDAKGRRHAFIDKVPGFTAAHLGPESVYPQSAYVSCEVLSTSQDEDGRAMAHITTAHPYDIESTEGLSEFEVYSDQLSHLP